MLTRKFNDHYLKRIYKFCCLEDVRINKPGNVSINSPIIGMDIKKFIRASEISSEILCKKNLTFEEKIFNSCKKCLLELDSNYNLGIILLCAPILEIAQTQFLNSKNLRKKLIRLLKDIDERGGGLILNAIKISKPGGIDNYKGKGDVNNLTEKFNFKEIMSIGAKKDRISECYDTYFEEIFNLGIPFFKKLKKRFTKDFSFQCLFIFYLSIKTDSHIQRKFGHTKAKTIQRKAIFISKYIFTEESKKTKKVILKFDHYLKKKNLNPGTCADLTVTTLLIHKITDIVRPSNLSNF